LSFTGERRYIHDAPVKWREKAGKADSRRRRDRGTALSKAANEGEFRERNAFHRCYSSIPLYLCHAENAYEKRELSTSVPDGRTSGNRL
jgi:hypothetical protein